MVDAQRRGIPGASVTDHGTWTSSATDAEGRFLVPYLPRTPVRITVTADGFLRRRLDVSEDSVNVVLDRGGVLRGRVLDAQGRGVANETVNVFDPASEDPARRMSDRTDETGGFEVRVPPGHYVVALWREKARVPVGEVDLEEGETATLEVLSPP